MWHIKIVPNELNDSYKYQLDIMVNINVVNINIIVNSISRIITIIINPIGRLVRLN